MFILIKPHLDNWRFLIITRIRRTFSQNQSPNS